MVTTPGAPQTGSPATTCDRSEPRPAPAHSRGRRSPSRSLPCPAPPTVAPANAGGPRMYPIDVTADYGDGSRSRGLAALGIVFPLKMSRPDPPPAHPLAARRGGRASSPGSATGWSPSRASCPTSSSTFPERTLAWQVRTTAWSTSLTDPYPPFEWEPTGYRCADLATQAGPGPAAAGSPCSASSSQAARPSPPLRGSGLRGPGGGRHRLDRLTGSILFTGHLPGRASSASWSGRCGGRPGSAPGCSP